MTASAHPNLRTRNAGFTLLEILVAITLLSGIMLALGASIRTLGNTEAKIDERTTALDNLRVTRHFLRSVLASISLRQKPGGATTGGQKHFFAGDADGVSWIGIMPANYGAGGRSYFRLAVEIQQDGQSALVLRYAPWKDLPDFPDWSTADSRTLIKPVTAFGIRYENAQASPVTWVSTWAFADRIPNRIQLQIDSNAMSWPLFVTPMRPTAMSAGININSLGP